MAHEDNLCVFSLNNVNQLNRRSGFERFVGQEVDYWTRGMYFTWIWEDLGWEWYGYNQFLFFRGTRKWYLKYVPFYWRNRAEFERFEKEFIERATAPRGQMSQAEFIRQARAYRTQVNLGTIQGTVVSVVAAKFGGAVKLAEATVSRVGRGKKLFDCVRGNEESCVSLIQDAVIGRVKRTSSP
jgi:hypothetical protein